MVDVFTVVLLACCALVFADAIDGLHTKLDQLASKLDSINPQKPPVETK